MKSRYLVFIEFLDPKFKSRGVQRRFFYLHCDIVDLICFIKSRVRYYSEDLKVLNVSYSVKEITSTVDINVSI